MNDHFQLYRVPGCFGIVRSAFPQRHNCIPRPNDWGPRQFQFTRDYPPLLDADTFAMGPGGARNGIRRRMKSFQVLHLLSLAS